MDEPRERYHNDPEFRMMVDAMRCWLTDALATVHEIRQAATVAGIIQAEQEMRRVHEYGHFSTPDQEGKKP